MVIERFKDGDPVPVYQRFRGRGRLTPEGLTYVSSWVEPTLDRCYQVMEAADRALLEQWMENWLVRPLAIRPPHPFGPSPSSSPAR
jgi:hypothetical protein